MSKHGTDERGWPLVPVDPAAIPNGYEPVRVGWAGPGDYYAETIDHDQTMMAVVASGCYRGYSLILRPIKPPIELPLEIVPHGWWVAKDDAGRVHLHEKETRFSAGGLSWVSDGQLWPLPPWIAAQLPAEWHELPWDKSAMQQTRGEG